MALSEVNKHDFFQFYGRDAKDKKELILYFIEYKSKQYADEHKEDK